MWFPKSLAHSDLKTVLNFIPRLNKAKVVEETMLGLQNPAFIYFDKITRIKIGQFFSSSDFHSLTNRKCCTLL